MNQRLLNLLKEKVINKKVMHYSWVQNGDILVRKPATSKIIDVHMFLLSSNRPTSHKALTHTFHINNNMLTKHLN